MHIGTIVARRYRLIQNLGSGEAGTVWLAHDLATNGQCALKLLEKLSSSGAHRKRCLHEAKLAAKLRGKHVAEICDYGEWNDIPFIAMEFLEGEDLLARLARVGSLDPRTTYELIAQIARALSRAHGLGLVHASLKPRNVFFACGEKGEIAKVLDFGIGEPLPGYMSPEQARGKGIDWRSDLWSLGVMAFECLTGHAPFESDALGDLLAQIMCDPIPQLTEQGVELPEGLDAWWRRAVARDREHRFQSAKELVNKFAHAAGLERTEFIPSITPRTAGSDEAPRSEGIAVWISEPPPVPIRLDAGVSTSSSPRPRPLAAFSAKKLSLIGKSVVALAVFYGLLTWITPSAAPEQAKAATRRVSMKPSYAAPPAWAALPLAQELRLLPSAEPPQLIVLPFPYLNNPSGVSAKNPSDQEVRAKKKHKSTHQRAAETPPETTKADNATPASPPQRIPDASPDYGI